ncbi:UNKNOWN [Stylonychia lemnae]|uniref:Uncharacterized protein n=1 Tax=Stylonychia lemnae TaxID=5949 RepID=A0A077ZR87_STYLE|nr:UNKNOWN [Stylonychia lemnae]|eukprot:CDW72407.1 UNKNOWN [Stylonychia lemnae]
MSVEPIQPDDYYKVDPKMIEYQSKFKGSEFLKFTNNARDSDRIEASIKNNQMLDLNPPGKIEKFAWQMRPRSKDKEIGPELRFNPRLQMERIYDSINNRKSPIFEEVNLTDHQLHQQVREFVKSGNVRHQSFNASNGQQQFRDSKLGFNNFFGNPQHIMNQLHKKSHFKGVTSLLMGQEGSLEVKPSQLRDVFQSIAQNLEIKRKLMKSAERTGGDPRNNTNGSISLNQTASTLQNKISKYKERIQSQRDIKSMSRKQSTDSRLDRSLIKVQNQAEELNINRISLAPFFAEDVDPKELSQDILKQCNIIRDKHFKTSLLRRKSGLGGGNRLNDSNYQQQCTSETRSFSNTRTNINTSDSNTSKNLFYTRRVLNNDENQSGKIRERLNKTSIGKQPHHVRTQQQSIETRESNGYQLL